MRISNEAKKEIKAGYQKAAKPRAYITEMCEKHGLRRETVRRIIGLRTRDPTTEEGKEFGCGEDSLRPFGPPPPQAEEARGMASRTPPPSMWGIRRGRPRQLGPDVERRIVEDLKAGMTQRACAEKYGCCEDTVHRIRQRYPKEIFPGRDLTKCGRPAISKALAEAMLADMRQGMTVAAAAKKYGCCEATVVRIRRRYKFNQQEE